jgi:hypothetical protein
MAPKRVFRWKKKLLAVVVLGSGLVMPLNHVKAQAGDDTCILAATAVFQACLDSGGTPSSCTDQMAAALTACQGRRNRSGCPEEYGCR